VVAGETGLAIQKNELQHKTAALAVWAKQQLRSFGVEGGDNAVERWTPLGGDAGFRHYFRLAKESLSCTQGVMAVWSPPATEKNDEFVRMAQHLKAGGVCTPSIMGYQPETGFLLVEDLGTEALLDRLNEQSVELLYSRALDVLLHIQQCPKDSTLYGRYDAAELNREMNLFSEWFVTQLLGYRLTDNDNVMISEAFQYLTRVALEQPTVVVHRDFHSRNIIYRDAQPFGIIDFQDGVLGPLTYDAVSLLRDCYVQWPKEKVTQWALTYAAKAKSTGLLPELEDTTFLRWFDCMGVQRHIKVLGIFARLFLRDGKKGYLNDLPLVIQYTRDVAGEYTELAPFVRWFDEHLMPRINQQPWMIKK